MASKKKPTVAQAFKAAQKASTKKAPAKKTSKTKSSGSEPFDPTYFDGEAMLNQPGMKRLPSQGRVDDKTVHIRKGKITSADGKYEVNVSTVETPYSAKTNTRAGKQSAYKFSAKKIKPGRNK